MNNKTLDEQIKALETTLKRIKNIQFMAIDIPEEPNIKDQLIRLEVMRLYE